MATPSSASGGPADSVAGKKGSDDELLDRIRKRYRYHFTAWQKIREAGAKSIQALSQEGPWASEERQARKQAGRPCIHLDQLTQYTNGFMGEVRQSPLAVK